MTRAEIWVRFAQAAIVNSGPIPAGAAADRMLNEFDARFERGSQGDWFFRDCKLKLPSSINAKEQ